MGTRLRLRHRPSNGMLAFVAMSFGIGEWLMWWPENIRDHDALDWLDPVNLAALGSFVATVSLLQLAADAMEWRHARALTSSLLCGLYLLFAVGIMRHGATVAVVPYTGLATIELLLARRRI